MENLMSRRCEPNVQWSAEHLELPVLNLCFEFDSLLVCSRAVFRSLAAPKKDFCCLLDDSRESTDPQFLHVCKKSIQGSLCLGRGKYVERKL